MTDTKAIRELLAASDAEKYSTPAGRWTESCVVDGTGRSFLSPVARALIVGVVNAAPAMLDELDALRARVADKDAESLIRRLWASRLDHIRRAEIAESEADAAIAEGLTGKMRDVQARLVRQRRQLRAQEARIIHLRRLAPADS